MLTISGMSLACVSSHTEYDVVFDNFPLKRCEIFGRKNLEVFCKSEPVPALRVLMGLRSDMLELYRQVFQPQTSLNTEAVTEWPTYMNTYIPKPNKLSPFKDLK